MKRTNEQTNERTNELQKKTEQNTLETLHLLQFQMKMQCKRTVP